MLFHSSLRKELSRSFGATLVVLITIVMTMTLIRTLGQATRGSVNPQEIMMIMGYTVLGYLPPVLTMSLFIAIVGTLSRLYQDSEMVIWFAAGRGPFALVRPLLVFAWPVLLVVLVLALVGWPWSNQQILDLKERYGSRGDLERVAPGQFQESASGNRVFFVDKDTPTNRAGKNIFIATTDRGIETITSARDGHISNEPQGQFLMLSNGQRMERSLKDGQMRLTDFKEMGFQVGTTAWSASDNVPTRARGTLTLLRDPTALNLGELAWRIGLALASLNFVLIAIGLSNVNPRAGRSGNLVFALFTFITYYNLVNLGQNWVSNGRIGFWPLMLALHGTVAVGAVLWLARQHFNWRLWPRWRRSGGGA